MLIDILHNLQLIHWSTKFNRCINASLMKKYTNSYYDPAFQHQAQYLCSVSHWLMNKQFLYMSSTLYSVL